MIKDEYLRCRRCNTTQGLTSIDNAVRFFGVPLCAHCSETFTDLEVAAARMAHSKRINTEREHALAVARGEFR